jgi:hypothetical protein
MSKISSRASSMKSGKRNRPKSRVTFTDELILADSIKYNDLDEVRATLKRSGQDINLDKKNDLGKSSVTFQNLICLPITNPCELIY